MSRLVGVDWYAIVDTCGGNASARLQEEYMRKDYLQKDGCKELILQTATIENGRWEEATVDRLREESSQQERSELNWEHK